MTQNDVFGKSKWVSMRGYDVPKNSPDFFVLRAKCNMPANVKILKATLTCIGLGFFYCYVNGKLITTAPFRPLSTDYEERKDYPVNEKLTGHRIYVPTFDVSDIIVDGDNSLCFYFGGGWYTFSIAKFGDTKLIYRLLVETDKGTFEFNSGEKDKITKGYIENYYFTTTEEQNLLLQIDNYSEKDFDDSYWDNAIPAKELDTNYLYYDDSLYDEIETEISTKCTKGEGALKYYVCEKNITGWVNLKLTGKAGDKVIVRFSEAPTDEGKLDERYHHGQTLLITDDGKGKTVHPMFTWFAFQCFSVEGNAELVSVEFIHMPINASSTFGSDSKVLNWIFDAFVNTEKCNMHDGLISDCPHIERRGYSPQ